VGEQNDVGRSRMPIARTRALNATPNARSLSRMRYFGARSHGNASLIWRASHSAVGFRVTAILNNRRRPWPRTRNANSCSKAIVGTTMRSIDAIPSPISGKAHSMPTHDGLGPDDGYGVKNARTATIEPNEQGSVSPTQMQSTWRALLQNIELMPQDQVFGFQPPTRLEAVAQHADEKEANCNH